MCVQVEFLETPSFSRQRVYLVCIAILSRGLDSRLSGLDGAVVCRGKPGVGDRYRVLRDGVQGG